MKTILDNENYVAGYCKAGNISTSNEQHTLREIEETPEDFDTVEKPHWAWKEENNELSFDQYKYESIIQEQKDRQEYGKLSALIDEDLAKIKRLEYTGIVGATQQISTIDLDRFNKLHIKYGKEEH